MFQSEKIISDEDFIKICEESITMAQAAKKIGIEYRALARRAKKLGCFKPNQSGKGLTKPKPNWTKRNTCNVDYFSIFTPQMAYWLGFIAADGCITKRNGIYKIFCFTLKEEDKKTVEQLSKDLEFTGEVKIFTHYSKDKSFNCASLTIFSIPLVEKLTEFGIVPQKSSKNIHYLSYIPEDYKEFFCFGFMDGDGSVVKDGEILEFLGSKEDCEEITKVFNFEKFSIKSENNKLLYNLRIYNKKDKVKFFDKYIEFSKDNWVLPRKLERIISFKNKN